MTILVKTSDDCGFSFVETFSRDEAQAIVDLEPGSVTILDDIRSARWPENAPNRLDYITRKRDGQRTTYLDRRDVFRQLLDGLNNPDE